MQEISARQQRQLRHQRVVQTSSGDLRIVSTILNAAITSPPSELIKIFDWLEVLYHFRNPYNSVTFNQFLKFNIEFQST